MNTIKSDLNTKVIVEKIMPVIAILKPVTSLLASILTIVIIYKNSDYGLIKSFIHSCPMLLITMSGFILNDLFDIEKDKKAETYKPIAKGEIKVQTAKFLISIFISAAFLLNLLLNNLQSIIPIVVTIVSVIIYSPLAFKTPPFKGLYTAILCCLPIWYGVTITSSNIHIEAILALAVFILGRELLLDIRDLEVDQSFGIDTLAKILPIEVAYVLGWILMFTGTIFLPFISNSNVGIILGSISILNLIICLILYKKNQIFALKMTRLSLLTGGICISLLSY